MFLLRSLFWLTIAFIAMRPGIDLRTEAEAISTQAAMAGRQVLVDHLLDGGCTKLPCASAPAAFPPHGATAASVVASEDPVAPVPLPRARPKSQG